jgi:hypothetical protein
VIGSDEGSTPSVTLISFYIIVIVKIAWDLEDPSFILVELVTLYEIPLFKWFRQSALELTSSYFKF